MHNLEHPQPQDAHNRIHTLTHVRSSDIKIDFRNKPNDTLGGDAKTRKSSLANPHLYSHAEPSIRQTYANMFIANSRDQSKYKHVELVTQPYMCR